MRGWCWHQKNGHQETLFLMRNYDKHLNEEKNQKEEWRGVEMVISLSNAENLHKYMALRNNLR